MKILVVDDEAPVREICSRLLKELGYAVETAASGEEAARKLDERFDIVLTDISMPGAVDGNELLRRVRASGDADVLIMTANPGLETAVQALRDGAYDYIVKPFEKDDMRRAVERCADKRKLSKDLARERALRAELDRAYSELAQSQRVRELFGQFITPEVAGLVLDHPEEFWKRGERREVTVLFADVRGFTPFAEKALPEEAVLALNAIFEGVVAAVRREGGILNKFIGDGMMALFGAPIDEPGHAVSAAKAALEAMDAVQKLTSGLRIGIGINTGEAVAGCLGTRERTEYSVIGHAVNVAARLEEIAGPGQILIGPETARRLESAGFAPQPLGRRSLTGVQEPIEVAQLSKSPVRT